MKLELVHIRRLKSGSPRVVSFEVPLSRAAEYAELVRKAQPLDKYDVIISTPKRGRSTGWRSQNNHTHGHYEDIAEQLSNDDITYSSEEIGRALKLMAMREGYWPPKMNKQGATIIDPITKALEPMSESDAGIPEAATLIEYIHQWADANGLWLTEYINDEPRRTYGGVVRTI